MAKQVVWREDNHEEGALRVVVAPITYFHCGEDVEQPGLLVEVLEDVDDLVTPVLRWRGSCVLDDVPMLEPLWAARLPKHLHDLAESNRAIYEAGGLPPAYQLAATPE